MNWKQEALQLHRAGISWRQIAKNIGVPRSTVSDYLRAAIKQRRTIDNDPTRIPEYDGIPSDIGVLILDLETAPCLNYTWGMYKQFVPVPFTVRSSHLLSFSCKWMDSDKVTVRGLPDYSRYETDRYNDIDLVRELYGFVNAADVIVAHNLFGFDEPVMKSRFIVHGFRPPTPYMTVDTLQIAKKEFRFPSNKLDYLSRFLRIGKKMEHSGAELWRGCIDGDMDCWATMLDYNAKDVRLLEELYLKIRPWDRGHPNVSLISDNDRIRCVCCGSDALVPHYRKAYTKVSEFDLYVCDNCGKVSRSRKSNKTKEERENILTNAR